MSSDVPILPLTESQQPLFDMNTDLPKKTQREWFEYAKSNGHEWADKALEYIKDRPAEDVDNNLYDFMGAVSGAFVWIDTQEGHDFWRKIAQTQP